VNFTLSKNILFIIYLFSYVLLAQEPVSVHLTEKDGLPDKEFYQVLEDKKGFVWLAADKGLYRYDGNEYKFYSHSEQVGLSVFSLTEDEEGNLWFTNLANQLFRIQNNKVELYLDLKKYFSGDLFEIEIVDNKIICSSHAFIYIVDKFDRQMLFDNKKMSYSSDVKYVIENDELISIYKDTIYKLDLNTFQKTKVKRKNKLNFTSVKNQVLKIDNKSNIQFLRKNNGKNNFYSLNSFSKEEYKLLNTSLSRYNIFIYTLKLIDNKIFILSDKGVFQAKYNKGNLTLENHFLKSINATDVIKDNQGNYWFTSLHQGIFLIPNFNLKIDFKSPEYNSIRKVMKGKSNELFFIGTQKEFYRFNTKSKKATSIYDDNVSEIKYLFNQPKTNHYFYQNALSNKKIEYRNNRISLISKIKVAGLIKDHSIVNNDSVLLAKGTSFGITTFDNYNLNRKFDTFSDRVRSYSCYFSNQSKIGYIGTVKGLVFYKKENDIKEIKYKGNSIYIKDIESIDGETIWCLSFKNGLYKIKKNKVIDVFNLNNGLLSNRNFFIEFDKKNNAVWIAGESGLQKFNTITKSFKNITKKDGLPSHNFVGLNLIGDELFVTTEKQVISFNTSKIFNGIDFLKPDPYFTLITVNGEEVNFLKELSLNSGFEQLQINYNTNGFNSRENINYEYRLSQVNKKEKKWQKETSKSNSIVYNNLPQGNYIFELRALDGNLKSEIKTIKVEVKGVFYEQLWFYIVSSFLVISLMYYYFKRKNKELKERQQLKIDKQQKEVENTFLKLESLRSQMNPHFIFNALNSIQDYILKNEKKMARNYLVKFSRLIRMFLEHSQRGFITLEEELNVLKIYLELEKDRFENTFEYHIHVDTALNIKEVVIPTFLIQPYVENAIKHGLLHRKENRKLNLKFVKHTNNNTLEIEIVDNGVGRVVSENINSKKPLKPKSFSSQANKKRIELINKTRELPIELSIQDLYDKDKIPLGAKVKISIPLEY